ncbi:MAG: arginyl-tRNA--protein-N-Asp/Glu arginylyltransferase [Candidatus Azotimanducaceae bacterium]|jgi:arginyl-tRNA--protein-N-Asp/Glu arginylyltransferase
MNDQTKLNFFASTSEPCSYLDDRDSISAFANPDIDMDMQTYSTLIQHGFRRSGGYVYRPHCPTCRECISVRVPVKRHKPSRNEKRILRLNTDIEINVTKGKFRQEHFDLYKQYIKDRHGDGSMANPTKGDYHRFLICDWTETDFIEFHLEKTLIAIAVTDVTDTGLSAVYTFFDPNYQSRSLGHFAILSQIKEAQSRDLEYLYLGYWIKDCDKMRYKNRYKPLEGFIENHWQDMTSNLSQDNKCDQ